MTSARQGHRVALGDNCGVPTLRDDRPDRP